MLSRPTALILAVAYATKRVPCDETQHSRVPPLTPTIAHTRKHHALISCECSVAPGVPPARARLIRQEISAFNSSDPGHGNNVKNALVARW